MRIAYWVFIGIMLLSPLGLGAQQVSSIGELFDSLKVNPVHKAYLLGEAKAVQNEKLARANLYPELSAFGKYDYSDSPAGMLPVPPNVLIGMVQNPSVVQPFSENIWRAGLTVSMPVFVKSIYTMTAAAERMVQAASLGAQIEMQRKEALLVGANANLQYLENMEKAIESKRNSLQKMKELISIKVNNGRLPGSALLVMNANINELELKLAQLKMNKERVLASIFALTHVKLSQSLPLVQTASFRDGDFVVLQPLKKKVEAAGLIHRAEKEKLYPSLVAQASYVHNRANSYNNNKLIRNDLTTAALVLKVPVFNKKQYAKIKLKNIEMQEQQNDYEKVRMEIMATSQQLQNSLLLLNQSIDLNKKSIKAKEELLEIAKKSYLQDRMSIDDYLKYEDDLLFEKARLYQTQTEKWQTLMQLAVIYGNNIETLVQ